MLTAKIGINRSNWSGALACLAGPDWSDRWVAIGSNHFLMRALKYYSMEEYLDQKINVLGNILKYLKIF